MRTPLLVSLVCAVTGACTLLNSRDGLVGPPLADDAGLDATKLVDGATPWSPGSEDAGWPSLDAGADAPGSPLDAAAQADGLTAPIDSGPPDAGPTAIYSQLLSPLG